MAFYCLCYSVQNQLANQAKREFHKDVVNKAVVPINANEQVLKMIAHVSKTK
jgi:hypothetical protein